MKDAPLPPSSERVGAKNDVSTRTIGEAWLDLAEKILNEGHSEKYDGLNRPGFLGDFRTWKSHATLA
jgi:hypothetical protein